MAKHTKFDDKVQYDLGPYTQPKVKVRKVFKKRENAFPLPGPLSLERIRQIKGPKVVQFGERDERMSRKGQPASERQRQEAIDSRTKLPVYQARDRIMPQILANQVTIVLAETGSGKSTQLPRLLWENDARECVAITQPRRIGAVSLAERVSMELDSRCGDLVGYSVRFAHKAGPRTRIKYMTDGMLMREMMLDPRLDRYTTVVLDEAHERTVVTDMLMGLLKQLIRGLRPDLRVIVMSATLDAQRFSTFFDHAPILYIEGRAFPVERFYLDAPAPDLLDTVVKSCCQLNVQEPPGDILVFLAGQEEIESCCDQLAQVAPMLPKEAPMLTPLPLYASLPADAQQRVFDRLPSTHRKVILATNIAETSVTISGVRYVIDSGLRKVRVWRPRLGLDTLLTTAESQASAAQRMGRAGREAPGKCFRLYTEQTYEEDMAAETEPEVVRADITHVVLTLKQAGVDNVVDFDWLQSPGAGAITAALLKLYTLKALDDAGQMTELGARMVVLPLPPPLSAVLLHAQESGSLPLLDAVLDICACLSVEDLLVNPPANRRDEVTAARHEQFGRARVYGDLIMLREMYTTFHSVTSGRSDWCKSVAISYKSMQSVAQVRRQLASYLGRNKEDDQDDQDEDEQEKVPAVDIVKTFLHGFINNTAVSQADRKFKTVITAQTLNIHPSSMVFGQACEAIMYVEYVYTTKGYARTVSPVQLSWLRELAPHVLGRRSA